MALTFRYKTITRPDGTKVKTPSVPLLLRGKENFETVALLDSGADISAIPKALADILGLDCKREITPAYGIGGQVDSVETTMMLTLGKSHERYSFQIPVKVILGSYDFPVLLGRVGFFDRFVISFNQPKEKVSLRWITGGFR